MYQNLIHFNHSEGSRKENRSVMKVTPDRGDTDGYTVSSEETFTRWPFTSSGDKSNVITIEEDPLSPEVFVQVTHAAPASRKSSFPLSEKESTSARRHPTKVRNSRD